MPGPGTATGADPRPPAAPLLPPVIQVKTATATALPSHFPRILLTLQPNLRSQLSDTTVRFSLRTPQTIKLPRFHSVTSAESRWQPGAGQLPPCTAAPGRVWTSPSPWARGQGRERWWCWPPCPPPPQPQPQPLDLPTDYTNKWCSGEPSTGCTQDTR